MRLVGLTVTELPGVDAAFSLNELSPHATVVIGPNASGKSSLVRALRAVLDQQVYAGQSVDVSAEFVEAAPDGNQVRWRARRMGPQITWQRDGQPVEAPTTPPRHLLDSYLVSVEALMQGGQTDEAIGDRLHRELSGGYDLPAARAAATEASGGQQRAARLLAEALTAQRELEGQRAALNGRLLQRGQLEQERRQAAELAARAPKYERALQLSAKATELGAARAQLGTYPPQLGKLSGTEAEALEQQKKLAAAAQQGVRSAEEGLAEARRAMAATGLGDAGADGALVHRLERAARRLQELADRGADLQQREAYLRGALQAPRKQLGGITARAAGADPEQVEELLSRRLLARAQLATAEQDLRQRRAQVERAHSRRAATPEADLAEPQLRAAQVALGAWLQEAATRAPAGPGALLLVAALLFALLTALALADGGTAWLTRLGELGAAALPVALVAVVAFVVATVWGALGRVRASRAGKRAEAAFARTGAAAPRAWGQLEVAERLQQLLAEAAQRQQASNDEAAALQLAEAAQGQVDAAAVSLAVAEQELSEVASASGYGGAVDASFAAWLRASRQVADLTDELRGVLTQRQALEQEADLLHEEVAAGLAGTPFQPAATEALAARFEGGRWLDSKLPLAPDLAERSERFSRAQRAWAEARGAATAAESELTRARSAAAQATRARAELLQRCGLNPQKADADAKLHALVASRKEYLRQQRQVSNLEAVVLEGEEWLRQDPGILELARAGDLAALALAQEEAKAAAERLVQVSEELGALDRDVRAAETERRLERARAQTAARRDDLQDLLQRAQRNALTELLFDDVEAQHRAVRRPRLLALAQEWFERFTHHAFSLEFDPGAARELRLGARDNGSGRRLTPEQLSTGTRAQLLLALRVAHAACTEGGGPRLPFFLDEALTTADAGRFEQVAASLLELSRDDGRQILYLSARNEDAAAWRRVAQKFGQPLLSVVDLAQVRRLSQAGAWKAEVVEAPPRQLSDPDDVPPRQFAAELGVRSIDPWQDAGAVHLFHLLQDDLRLVRRLALAHIDTAGQARSLLKRDGAALLDQQQATGLSLRLAGLAAWQEAWRSGRNVPVDAAALRETGAVTDRFLPDVTALAARVNGDPRALLDALEAGAVPYFRTNAVQELEASLSEMGHFDAQPTLPTGQRIVMTAKAMARAAGAGALPEEHMERAGALVTRLEAALSSGKEHA